MKLGSKVLGSILVLAAAMLLGLAGSGGATAQDSSGATLKIGWAQDVRTMSPFFGYDEENFVIWSLNYDLLVNFDPEDLSPAPGIAESWEIADDRKSVTFHLEKDLKWSDGKPLTSADVKWSLETLGDEGALFTGYTSNVSSIETPDADTVIVNTKKPDARIVGGLFLYILPKHIWDKVPVEDLKSYEPKLPIVGSGPYTVTEYERGRIVTMDQNPEWRGEPQPFDQVEFIKYGTQDAVERALSLGEVDFVREVESSSFERLGEQEDITVLKSPSPSYSEMAFNLCPEDLCPDGERNPAVLDPAVRQATAYAVDRARLNEIAYQGTSFVANGLLPSYYRDFYTEPDQTYPYDPELANQILDEAGWVMGDDGVREKDGERLSFDLYARSESPETVQMAKLIAESTADIGIEYNVQVVSTDKLTELTVRKVDGKPAPDFDTFIWGWGGDPYDPSLLLDLVTTKQIGGSSDSFYSNPEYDRLYEKQATIFDVEERRAVIAEMLAITQEDLPYIVLTEDPALQAYRNDKLEEIQPICPAETGDLICDQVSYEGVMAMRPIEGASSGDSGSGFSGPAALVGIVIGFIGGVLVTRRRRGDDAEPLELPE
ncbi:MAG: peptide ABC transporter substrate-binding protein [Solirubrobacterales bacterium]